MRPEDPRLPHTGAAALFHEGGAPDALMAALGYQFAGPDLLRLALTHPSAHQQRNNQRLEFLGDAVLQLVISEELYKLSREAEGRLTFRRQRLVNERALALVARGIGLGNCLLMDSALKKEGGDSQDSVLADAMEAVVAAVYLDGGIEAARDVVLRLWSPLIAQADAALDKKGALQAVFQARGEGGAEYVTLSEEGPAHRRLFTVAVSHAGKELARAQGRSKREASRLAAEKALEALGDAEGRE